MTVHAGRMPARLLVVTDRHQAARPLRDLADELFAAGLRWLWLRDKDLPASERYALARDLARIAACYGATLTVGADIGLAAEIGAGAQLGARADASAARRCLTVGAPIGVSAHSLEDVARARDAGVDYATLSPIFLSASKPGYGPALGLGALREASGLGLPVLALGGVRAAEARACIDAGAAGIAVTGPIMRGGRAALEELLHAVTRREGRTPANGR